MLRALLKISLVSIFACHLGFIMAATTKQDQEPIKQAYANWCSAIGSAKGNASEVVKYYAPGAILLPTLSSKKLINTNGGLDSYFQKLTSLPDIKCTPKRSTIRMHNKMATNSGFYIFSYKDDHNKQKDLTARFTFVYKKVGDQWLIESHHSSKSPKI